MNPCGSATSPSSPDPSVTSTETPGSVGTIDKWTTPATCLSCMTDFDVPDDERAKYVSRHGFAICATCARARGTTDPKHPNERVKAMTR